MSWLARALAIVPNVRAAAFRQSDTEVGVEGLAAVATSTTSATTLAGLSFNGLDGNTATSRGLLLDAQEGFTFVVDTTQAKEFALAHWLVNGADGGRLFVRCFGGDGTVRENAGGDVLASLTTMVWNAPSKSWTGGATMADASLNRRMTVRLGEAVAFAQIGVVGLDGQIELEALRLYGLPEAAPALLCGTPTLPVGAARIRRGDAARPAVVGAGRGASGRRDCARRPAGRPRGSLARLLHALHRARRLHLDEQHGARDGAQRLGSSI